MGFAFAQLVLINPVDAHAEFALPDEVILQDFPQLIVEGNLHYAALTVLGVDSRHLEILGQLGEHIEAAHCQFEVWLDGMVDVPDRPHDAGGSADALDARRSFSKTVLVMPRLASW